jgi:uncharacterized protein DUF2568
VSMLRGIILAIRFACELAMVVALGYWGFQAVDGTPAWLLWIGAPAVAIAIWGTFRRAEGPVAGFDPRPACDRVALFGAAAAGLIAAGQPLLAALLAVAAGITSILKAATASDETRSAV